MNTYNFQEQINHIRKDALNCGFSQKTLDGYFSIWNKFIKWKSEDNFIYNNNDYEKFLLECYNFDINTYTSKSKSYHQQLMRSKRMLDDFNGYKNFITRRVVKNNEKDKLSKNLRNIITKYLNYCRDIKYNSITTLRTKENYITNILTFMEINGLNNIQDINKPLILLFISNSINKGERSKSRYFYVLRDFLLFLYDENILNVNLGYLIPTCRTIQNKRVPTYIKKDKIDELLKNIPRNRKIDKRNYAIILMASEIGLRISDILNLTFDNIDWEKKEITLIQRKTKKKNNLPISNELGWALIDYIKNARPITKCRNVFVRHSEPFCELKHFHDFNKYFDKANIEINDENKKGIHNLRYSLATRLLDNEIPLTIISKTLGHSNTETAKVYLKIDKNKLKTCCLEVD